MPQLGGEHVTLPNIEVEGFDVNAGDSFCRNMFRQAANNMACYHFAVVCFAFTESKSTWMLKFGLALLYPARAVLSCDLFAIWHLGSAFLTEGWAGLITARPHPARSPVSVAQLWLRR